jgi:dTDP-4-amino-4,6-dideoxygalactose transaminase
MLAIRALTQGKTRPRIGIPAFACASLWFAVKAAQAEPVLMDCNADLTLETDQAYQTAQSLDVLVLVHPFGMVEPLAAETFACPVIEDIAQSVGATLHGKPVGTFADVCIGSLYATKPWGGAYGGFIASHQHNIIQDCHTMINPDHADLAQDYVGHHQLSNIHAALAQQRITQAEQACEQRKHWAAAYDGLMANVDAMPIHTTENSTGNHFRYIVRCQQEVTPIIQAFRDLGIAASRPVQQPLHHADAQASCPQAQSAWQHCLSLPILADMNQEEFKWMQQGIQTCLLS